MMKQNYSLSGARKQREREKGQEVDTSFQATSLVSYFLQQGSTSYFLPLPNNAIML
jgi:hypothetical protein